MRRLPLLALLLALAVTRISESTEDPKQPDDKPEPRQWKPLWDGKTLKGWHKIGAGEWKIEDGAIVGRNQKEQDFGHLVSDDTYTDFTVRLKFKSVSGNSGFYFRIKKEGFSGVSGFQAEIDPQNDVGGLYETNGRGWVVKPTPEEIQKFYKPGEWNEMTVSAKGGHIVVQVNGTRSAEIMDDPGPWKEGHFALQVHGGQDVLVMFKDIELLQTPPEQEK